MVQLKPGTGRADISPSPGTPQGSWGAQTHQRGLVNDLPLYATALVLDEGAHQVAIVDVHSTSFGKVGILRIDAHPQLRPRTTCNEERCSLRSRRVRHHVRALSTPTAPLGGT